MCAVSCVPCCIAAQQGYVPCQHPGVLASLLTCFCVTCTIIMAALAVESQQIVSAAVLQCPSTWWSGGSGKHSGRPAVAMSAAQHCLDDAMLHPQAMHDSALDITVLLLWCLVVCCHCTGCTSCVLDLFCFSILHSGPKKDCFVLCRVCTFFSACQ